MHDSHIASQAVPTVRKITAIARHIGPYLLLAVVATTGLGLWRFGVFGTHRLVSPVVDNVTSDLTMKTIECVDYKIPPEKLWFGQPAPAVMLHIKETRQYLAWREQFKKALPLLAKHGLKREAQQLRTWFHQFQASEIGRIKSGGHPGEISPLFSQPQVYRLVRIPPRPAYEKFTGYKVVLPWENSVYYYPSDTTSRRTSHLPSKNGILYKGTPLRQRKDISTVFGLAGVKDRVAQDVLVKVSGQEGSFDAVNTWDSGNVSAGFLGFSSDANTPGSSLAAVLQRMKSASLHSQKEFNYYFARRGINLQDGRIVVRRLTDGKMLTGSAALRCITNDKRFVAVFQNAGAHSKEFQVAQIREAYLAYYLADRVFRLPVAELTSQTADQPATSTFIYGQSAVSAAVAEAPSDLNADIPRPDEGIPIDPAHSVSKTVRRLPDIVMRYRDILPSEAGLVTLTDRAVQKGVANATQAFVNALVVIAGEKPLVVQEIVQHEPEMIARIKNQKEVLPAHEINQQTPAAQAEIPGTELIEVKQ